MADFSTLNGIYEMFAPIDMAGTSAINLGGPLQSIGDETNPFKQLLNVIENGGRGVYNIDDMIQKIQDIRRKKEFGNVDLSKYLTIWSTRGIVDLGDESAKHKLAVANDGSMKNVTSLQQIIGADFKIPSDRNVAVILSRSPFFNPTTRNTKKGEIFLNSMPSTVLSQLVPYMQVEFQFTRDPSDQLQTAGMLKFLMGAADAKDLNGANRALVDSHVRRIAKDNVELDYMGMEAFTMPSTLTNPQPNSNVGRYGSRYVDVLDPFRPFATLEHVNISAKPSGAGFFCYKKASMTIKVHDRSRLNEISDLLRPRVYTGVTIWMTYGWRAPSHGTQNPYFKYVNDNLMMREAYHIINSNFSFDHQGQVIITLELFTKGVAELRELKITDNSEDDAFRMSEVKRLIEQISHYRQRLKLDAPEGLNKELRVYQILDAAETGTFPDMKASEVNERIDVLKASLTQRASIDKDALNSLVKAMKDLYKPETADQTKFNLKQQYEKRVAATVEKMFNEVRTGDDPFLPGTGKGLGPEITKIVQDMNGTPTTKVKKALKSVVSFGKLFTVFAMRSIISIPETIHETQVFFYRLNESCGPISGHSIAEFPIDMNQFIDQFNDLAKSRGGEKITLEDFLALCINAQFLDKRAIGYGLRQYYEPYAKGKEAQLKSGKDVEANFESQIAKYSSEYGPFHLPVIEMFIECSHERVSDAGQSDILQAMVYSAAESSTLQYVDVTGKAARRIMRIHVYDKHTNAYQAAAQLLKNPNNTGFFSAPSTDYAKSYAAARSSYDPIFETVMQFVQDEKTEKIKIVEFTNAQEVKNLIGKMVPTIRYGANGTTVLQANLASKADPLLSTVQMIRSQTIRNTASPNGAGAAGIPLRVIPAQLSMTSLGNPLATMAQQYFVDFQTGTTLDNLYIVTGLTHNFAPGKFDTQWTMGFADGYGVFEGAPTIVDAVSKIDPVIPKDPTRR